MKLSELQVRQKKQLGWKWYWLKIVLLFDWKWQYDCYLDRRVIHHFRKSDYHRKKASEYADRLERFWDKQKDLSTPPEANV